jgi:hypothetical protein
MVGSGRTTPGSWQRRGEAGLQISGRSSVGGDKMPRYVEIGILLIGEDP